MVMCSLRPHSHREGAFYRHHPKQVLTVKGRSFEIIRPLHRALRAAKDFMGYASNFTSVGLYFFPDDMMVNAPWPPRVPTYLLSTPKVGSTFSKLSK